MNGTANVKFVGSGIEVENLPLLGMKQLHIQDTVLRNNGTDWTIDLPTNNPQTFPPVHIDWVADNANQDVRLYGQVDLNEILPWVGIAVGFIEVELIANANAPVFQTNSGGWEFIVDFGPYFDLVELFSQDLVPDKYRVLVRFAFRALRTKVPGAARISFDFALFLTGNPASSGSLTSSVNFIDIAVEDSGPAVLYPKVTRTKRSNNRFRLTPNTQDWVIA